MNISFHNQSHTPVTLPEQTNLSEGLNIHNSPVLFGCRTGVCGTCLCRVTVVKGTLNPPTADEIELLEIIAPDDKQARLACCIQGHGDIELEIEYLG